MIINRGINKKTFIDMLKRIAIILFGIFIILSIIPYLLPLNPLPEAPFEPTFENSTFLYTDGVIIHYRQWNENNEEKVLLVHGFAGSTFSWRYTAEELAEKGYHVIAVDLPGFGLSERTLNFTPTAKNRAELLWDLLESMAFGADWHLVGHSMGGGVVTAMALQNPERVKSITMVAGAVPDESRRFNWVFHYPPLQRTVRHLATRVFLTEENVQNALASAYGRLPEESAFKGYYRPLLIEDTDAALVEMLKTSEKNLLNEIESLRVPVLLIWGEEDAWVQLEEGYKLDSLLPDSELAIMPGEGHCPMETNPEEFNNILLQFLDDKGL